MPRRFTILHTNDLHSALIGVGPSSEYTPKSLDDDVTIGGFARLATLIRARRDARAADGPVLVLDGGDYSMGTVFGAADPETGGDLRVLELMGYDATTLGNHEFDLGPDGLARSIEKAGAASDLPVAIVSTDLDADSTDPRTAELARVVAAGGVSRTLVIERGGIRFGILGVMGKQARSCILDPAAVRFIDPIEAATRAAHELRTVDDVHVVIGLSHGGLLPDADGAFTIGPDVDLAIAVPGIDVVIGGHSHTQISPPIAVDGGRPVVQAGKFGERLGELVVTIHDDGSVSATNLLWLVDDSIPGDPAVEAEVERLAVVASEMLFAADGLRIDQPLAIASADLPNTFTDLSQSAPLADLVTDAFRAATGAEVAVTVNGLIRSAVRRGAHGVQTVYDVFGLTPIGEGVSDTAIGTHLVTATMSARRLHRVFELLLADAPRRPGRHVPRTSGLRYSYRVSAPPFERVVSLELGDAARGYRTLDLDDERPITVAMPANLSSISTRAGGELSTELESLVAAASQPDPPVREWEAVVRHLQRMARDAGGVLPVIPDTSVVPELRIVEVWRPRGQATSSRP